MKKHLHISHKKSTSFTGNETYGYIEENAPKRLTMEQVRKCKQFEFFSDEEIENIIDSLYQLAVVSYYIYVEKSKKSLDIAA